MRRLHPNADTDVRRSHKLTVQIMALIRSYADIRDTLRVVFRDVHQYPLDYINIHYTTLTCSVAFYFHFNHMQLVQYTVK